MAMRAWQVVAVVLAAAGLRCAVAAPAEIGTLTIADGAVTLQRGAQRHPAPAGLRLRADDVLITDDAAPLARVEFDDGKVADLGPGTQVMLAPRSFGPAADRDGTVYLGRGWLKLAAPWQQTTPAALASARVDVQQLRGTLVAQVTAGESWVYLETGRATVLPRVRRLQETHALARGEWFRQTGSDATMGRDTPNGWLDGMPRMFFETLPRLAKRFLQQPAELPPAVGPAVVPAWQVADRALPAPVVVRPAPARVAVRRADAKGGAS